MRLRGAIEGSRASEQPAERPVDELSRGRRGKDFSGAAAQKKPKPRLSERRAAAWHLEALLATTLSAQPFPSPRNSELSLLRSRFIARSASYYAERLNRVKHDVHVAVR